MEEAQFILHIDHRLYDASTMHFPDHRLYGASTMHPSEYRLYDASTIHLDSIPKHTVL